MDVVLVDSCICLISPRGERCSPVDIDSIFFWGVKSNYQTKVDLLQLVIAGSLASCENRRFLSEPHDKC